MNVYINMMKLIKYIDVMMVSLKNVYEFLKNNKKYIVLVINSIIAITLGIITIDENLFGSLSWLLTGLYSIGFTLAIILVDSYKRKIKMMEFKTSCEATSCVFKELNKEKIHNNEKRNKEETGICCK